VPQLTEDEWPADDQPTTTEQEVREDSPPETSGVTSEYPPDLPPDATPTRD
jgi:hypothetical protein